MPFGREIKKRCLCEYEIRHIRSSQFSILNSFNYMMAVNETDVFKFGGTFKKVCSNTPSSKNSSQTSYFTIHARILQIRDKREDDYTTF